MIEDNKHDGDPLAFGRGLNLDDDVLRTIAEFTWVGRVPWAHPNGWHLGRRAARNWCKRIWSGHVKIEAIERVLVEQRAVEEEIRIAFRGVSREGGVSYRQADLWDIGHFTEAEYAAAGAMDCERSWEELIDSREWDHVNRWPFYDKIGFRYYLPAGMIRTLREGDNDFLAYNLRWSGAEPDDMASLLTSDQRAVVARFIRYMMAVHQAWAGESVVIQSCHWRDAYENVWSRFDRDAPAK